VTVRNTVSAITAVTAICEVVVKAQGISPSVFAKMMNMNSVMM
jgi:hypothetical protein